MYDSRRLRGWNRFAGSSLVPFAAMLVRLQVKQEGGGYVLWFFETIILCMILAGCAGETGLRQLSSHVCGDFGSPPSEMGVW